MQEIVNHGCYNPSLPPSCITFATVDGCIDFPDAVRRLLKIDIYHTNLRTPNVIAYELLVGFRTSESKTAMVPLHRLIEGQLKPYAQVRVNNRPKAAEKRSYMMQLFQL